jgi:type I restriction enzyme M protein
MFEQTFKNIDDILHKDAGCSSELDYVEQTSWILFLKYLDDLEKDKVDAAELSDKPYLPFFLPEFQWSSWAAPKLPDGKRDSKALDGDDLTDFVNNQLFPYLKKFKSESPDTIEYKIGEIFSEIKNRIQSGYTLREVIHRIDELRFRTYAKKHEMSHLYEDKDPNTCDLSAKNPHQKEVAVSRTPSQILHAIKALDEQSADILNSIFELL